MLVFAYIVFVLIFVSSTLVLLTEKTYFHYLSFYMCCFYLFQTELIMNLVSQQTSSTVSYYDTEQEIVDAYRYDSR